MGPLWKIFTDNRDIIMMAPGLFLAAIATGWLAGWVVIRLVYNQRLAHQQDMIAKLRAVLEEKLPASFLPSPKQSRPMLLPLILSGLGLAFIGLGMAATGVYWQGSEKPALTSALPIPEGPLPVPVPTVDVMGRPLPKDPYQPGPILLKKYTRNEAQIMIDALSKITDTATDSLKLEAPTDFLPPDPMRPFQRTPWIEAIRKSGIDAAITKFSDFGLRAKALSDALENTIQSVPRSYADDLYRILGRSRLNELSDAATGIIYRLKAVKKLSPEGMPESEILAIYLEQPTSNFLGILRDVFYWRGTFQQRSPAARHEIEAYL
jgi:hypothetical protein